MRIVYHLITGYADPTNGGMEQSISRIADYFVEFGESEVTIYSRLSNNFVSVNNSDLIHIIPIASIRSHLLEPINENQHSLGEKNRCDFLIIKREIKKKMDKFQDAFHLIVSFYISTSGFIGQEIADELGLKHIACIRGTDFNRDFRDQSLMPAITYVLNKAEYIITTNNSQKIAVQHLVGKNTKIETIYNSISEKYISKRWQNHSRPFIRIISDGGFSSKKATHLLINSITNLLEQGIPVYLYLIGPICEQESNYWKSQLNKIKEPLRRKIQIFEYCNYDKLLSLFIKSDLYCSASIGEGCSNSSILALCLGIPMVATKVGALPEIAVNIPHISLVEPGYESELFNALKNTCLKILEHKLVVDDNYVQKIRQTFSAEREKRQWEQVIQAIVPRRKIIKAERQKRVLFFVHDGIGLGHLKRLSRLGGSIQGLCACLMVTGHWATPSIIPDTMEFVHLPSFDSLLDKKSSYWGRDPFLKISHEDAIKLRTRLLESVVTEFDPDLIVVDYLPLGHHMELLGIISNSRAKKYFIMRGVLDVPGNVRMDLLWGEAEAALINKYDRLLVAGDKKICDVINEYELKPELANKLQYIGYVSSNYSEYERERIRFERGLDHKEHWVICSAGGGALGEELINECNNLPNFFPKVYFDIIHGPRTKLNWPFISGDLVTVGRVRYLKFPNNLDKLHNAANIVITSGGYNSILEAMEGGAQIICSPSQRREGGEQQTHAIRLSKYYPIEVLHDHSQLKNKLDEILYRPIQEVNIRSVLNFEGIENFRKIVFSDLDLEIKISKFQNVV